MCNEKIFESRHQNKAWLSLNVDEGCNPFSFSIQFVGQWGNNKKPAFYLINRKKEAVSTFGKNKAIQKVKGEI